jgi:hypothetical protein
MNLTTTIVMDAKTAIEQLEEAAEKVKWRSQITLIDHSKVVTRESMERLVEMMRHGGGVCVLTKETKEQKLTFIPITAVLRVDEL